MKQINIDVHAVYSYKGYKIHQTRDEDGQLKKKILILRDDQIIKEINNIAIIVKIVTEIKIRMPTQLVGILIKCSTVKCHQKNAKEIRKDETKTFVE